METANRIPSLTAGWMMWVGSLWLRDLTHIPVCNQTERKVRSQTHPRIADSLSTTRTIQKEAVDTQVSRVHHQITQTDTQGPRLCRHTVQNDTALAFNHSGTVKHTRGLPRIVEAHMRGIEQPMVKDCSTQAVADDMRLLLISNGAAVEAHASEETPTQTFSPEQEAFLQVQMTLHIRLVRRALTKYLLVPTSTTVLQRIVSVRFHGIVLIDRENYQTVDR